MDDALFTSPQPTPEITVLLSDKPPRPGSAYLSYLAFLCPDLFFFLDVRGLAHAITLGRTGIQETGAFATQEQAPTSEKQKCFLVHWEN